MNNIPDLVGYTLESALSTLSQYNYDIIIKETFGKKDIKSDKTRILRQTTLKDNKLQLIIAYF